MSAIKFPLHMHLVFGRRVKQVWLGRKLGTHPAEKGVGPVMPVFCGLVFRRIRFETFCLSKPRLRSNGEQMLSQDASRASRSETRHSKEKQACSAQRSASRLGARALWACGREGSRVCVLCFVSMCVLDLRSCKDDLHFHSRKKVWLRGGDDRPFVVHPRSNLHGVFPSTTAKPASQPAA